MNDSKPVAVASESIKAFQLDGYPEPFSETCRLTEKSVLGDVFDLFDFGGNLVKLPPESWSSQRHWHRTEEEFVYVVEGKPTLITNEGETVLAPGMCAGFKAGVENGHHIVNRTDTLVIYLEVGTRRGDDEVDYPDIDLRMRKDEGEETFIHNDSTPCE